MKKLVNFLHLLLLLVLNQVVKAHHVQLGPRLDLSWSHISDHALQFRLDIVGRVDGYVSVGFSPSGGMKGADIAMVLNENDTIVLEDRYSISNQLPIIDESQDLTLKEVIFNDTHTIIVFDRDLITCDPLHDNEIGSDTTRIIWAFGENQDYHGPINRGVRSVYLGETSTFSKKVFREEQISNFDIVVNEVRLPQDDHTLYHCQIFEAPRLSQKHHIIGFEPIIEKGHEGLVHHMVLFECPWSPSLGTEFSWHAINNVSSECYSPNMPESWSFCLATNTFAWAVGSDGEMLPDQVGVPFGGPEQAKFYMLEVHYDNPAIKQGIRDNSGLRLFYTSSLRPHDGGMIVMGSEVNLLHLIPPFQSSFKSSSRCTAKCTHQGLPSQGINVVSVVLHSHLAGRKLRLRHVRGSKELRTIVKDDYYDFNLQMSRKPGEEVLLLPGDELIMECFYNTSQRSAPTFGGLSTKDEMCLAFVLVYPRPELVDCRSLPQVNTFARALDIELIGKGWPRLKAFLADIDNDDHEENDEHGSKLERLMSMLEQPKLVMSEQDILNQPFYTVESNQPKQLTSSYRTTLRALVMSLTVRTSQGLDTSLAEYMENIFDFTNESLVKRLEQEMNYGTHNSLCLAHARRPLLKYEPTNYPLFEAFREELNRGCKNGLQQYLSSDCNQVLSMSFIHALLLSGLPTLLSIYGALS